jgi:3-oxoacyl-[acyl-carrier protein] reductase
VETDLRARKQEVQSMGTLKDKRALVTGGGQGIGKAIVEELAGTGCHVAIHYHSSETGAMEVRRLAESLSVRANCFKADLTIESEVASVVKQSVDFLGGLDVLINNAGDLVERRFLQAIDLSYWNKVIDINLTSMMLVTREALPYLMEARNASIVNISSLAGRKGGHPGSLCYSSSKGAVLTWTRALSAEIGPKGIRVNAVAPGLILGTHFHSAHTTKESAEKTISTIPLGRAGTPQDVARAVAFLASEYDGFINGATLDVNGGVYCV